MKLNNSTPWNSNDLRKLFRKCVQEVEKVEKPSYKFKDRHRQFTLEFKNTTWGERGRATLNGYWIMIKIPKRWHNPEITIDRHINPKRHKELKLEGDSKTELKTKEIESLACLIIHEYYHTLGFSNQDKHNYKKDFTKSWDVSWVKDYSIKKKIRKIKTKIDVKEKRYNQALVNLKKAKTRKRRSDTLYKKWLNKVAYYKRVYNL